MAPRKPWIVRRRPCQGRGHCSATMRREIGRSMANARQPRVTNARQRNHFAAVGTPGKASSPDSVRGTEPAFGSTGGWVGAMDFADTDMEIFGVGANRAWDSGYRTGRGASMQGI